MAQRNINTKGRGAASEAKRREAEAQQAAAAKQAEDEARACLERALSGPSVPKLYANGFSLGLGNADTWILFGRTGQPVALMNLSYTAAKTLHQKLGRLVAEFEARAGQSM